MRPIAAFAALIALALSAVAAPAGAAPVDTGHVKLELAPLETGVAPGTTTHVALVQTITPGWHTYWRNPGDSGEATRIGWTLPAGWSAGDIVWAPPQRLPVGPLMNYGYSGRVILPVPVTAPASAKAGGTVRLTAKVDLLVCEEICIPETGTVAVEMPVTASPAPHPRWGAPVARALSAAPKPAGLTARFTRTADGVVLAVAGEALAGTKAREAYFFAYQADAVEAAKRQPVERGPRGLTLTLAPGYAFQSPSPPRALAGVISVDGRVHEITAEAGPAPDGAGGLGAVPPATPASPGGAGAAPGGALVDQFGGAGGGGLGLPLALVFAFAGGLILNLMPCVFPVLSMKAASLAGHGHERAAARVQGLAFTAGVVATFLALAVGLIALKAAGSAVGWGFQLQSPAVVAGLCLLMLLIALNLSGVFEAGLGLQGAGAAGGSRSGIAGAVLTGALAVVVAAPCTAPFMAGALGYALVQPAPAALLVFLALALGFAAPFLALSLSPSLLARLPRPGPWMETLRRILAFPMYGAAAWLAWVLALQAGGAALAALFAAGVLVAFAAWLFGVWQRSRLAGQPGRVAGGFAIASAVLASVIAVAGLREGPPPAAAASPASEVARIAADAYSQDHLDALRAEGRPVFVNFTAAWCVTCQVNERTALSRKSVADAFARTNTAYLKADWTRKDETIARALASHGRAGVPLYLVYGRGAAQPRILPQLLTEGTVVAALEKAASAGA